MDEDNDAPKEREPLEESDPDENDDSREWVGYFMGML